MIHTYNLSFLLLLLLFSCSNDRSESSGENERKNDVIYEIITNPDLKLINHEKIVLSDKNVLLPPSLPPEYSDELEYLTDVLNEKDTPFLAQQLKSRDRFTTTVLQEKGIHIVPAEELSQMKLSDFLDQENIEGFYSISMPVFNKDFTMAYIRIGYICEILCGGGQEIVLEKENEKWRVHKELGVWVY